MAKSSVQSPAYWGKQKVGLFSRIGAFFASNRRGGYKTWLQ
jgi:hypothetical protein